VYLTALIDFHCFIFTLKTVALCQLIFIKSNASSLSVALVVACACLLGLNFGWRKYLDWSDSNLVQKPKSVH